VKKELHSNFTLGRTVQIHGRLCHGGKQEPLGRTGPYYAPNPPSLGVPKGAR
jgi:hypothetical protein